MSELADFLLAEACVQERRRDVVLAGGLLSGAEVTLVVSVHAVRDRLKAALGAQRLHHRKKFVFAVKAALTVVANVVGVVEFGGDDDFDRYGLFSSEGESIGELSSGQAGRIGDHCEHFLSEFAMGNPGQIGRIDATRVGHQHAAKPAQVRPELRFLRENGMIRRHVVMVTGRMVGNRCFWVCFGAGAELESVDEIALRNLRAPGRTT
jgi:hypothetical protein